MVEIYNLTDNNVERERHNHNIVQSFCKRLYMYICLVGEFDPHFYFNIVYETKFNVEIFPLGQFGISF